MRAANLAISSPLLEDACVEGARGVIINVTGGLDLSLIEVSEASGIIQEAAHEDANIIFGAVVDPRMDGNVKITVIATGFDRPAPRTRSRLGRGHAGGPAVVRRLEAGGRRESPRPAVAAHGCHSRGVRFWICPSRRRSTRASPNRTLQVRSSSRYLSWTFRPSCAATTINPDPGTPPVRLVD